MTPNVTNWLLKTQERVPPTLPDGAAGENFDCLVQFSIDFALENAISMSNIPKSFACGTFWYSFSIDLPLEIAISMSRIVKIFALRAPILCLNYTELPLLRMVWKWKRNVHNYGHEKPWK